MLAAEAIEANLPQVEALILTMRGFIANGMDWLDLAELIKEEGGWITERRGRGG